MANNDKAELSKYKRWLDNNPDKQGTDDYKTVEAQYLAMGGMSDEIESLKEYVADPETTSAGRLGAAVAYPFLKGKDIIKSAGIKGAPAVAGQIIGQRVMGPVGGRIGAGVGALGGSIADQIGRTGSVRAGETLADVGGAVLQPRSVGKSALTSGAMATMGQLIDTGTVDPKVVAGAAAMGGVGAQAAKGATPKPILDAPSSEYFYRYQALNDVKKYGVKVNPRELERGSEALHTFAGSDAMSIAAARNNQQAWQKMVREQVDLPVSKKSADGGAMAFKPARRKFGTELEDGEIDLAVNKAAEPYRVLEEISEKAGEEVKLLAEQKLKNGKYVTSFTTPEGIDAMIGAKSNWKQIQALRKQKKAEYAKMEAGDPQAFSRIQAMKELEGELEKRIEDAAVASGVQGLKEQLIEARKKIAILKAADNATTSYGLISPKRLSQMYAHGEPLSGNLEKIAVFYDAFAPSSIERASISGATTPGVAANYAARNVAQGNVSGLLSGGFPILSKGARAFIMRESAQNRLLQPTYITPQMGLKEAALRQFSQMGSQQLDNER